MNVSSDRMRTWAPIAFVAIFFVAYTAWYLWPLPISLTSSYYGSPGDATGSIAVFRELAERRVIPFVPGRLVDFGYPEGATVPWLNNLTSFSSVAPAWLLAIVLGAAPALNLMLMIGFVMTGVSTALLVRWLTSSFVAGLLSGWVFAFFPFMVVNAAGHAFFVHGWTFTLLCWRLIVLLREPSRRNGLIAGFTALIAGAWNPYWLLMVLVILSAFAAVLLVWKASSKQVRKVAVPTLLSYLPLIIYMCLLALLVRFQPIAPSREWPLEALTVYGSRWREFVIPHGSSVFVGDFTAPWIAANLHGSNPSEATLYVGLGLLVLAGFGLISGLRRGSVTLGTSSRWVTLALALTVITCFVFSAPPQINLPLVGLEIWMPSRAVYEVMPALRVYSRFVVPLMLPLAILGGAGLARLVRLGRQEVSPARKVCWYSLAAVISGFVVVDLYVPPFRGWTQPLRGEKIYERVMDLPGEGAIAEYPIEPYGVGDYSAEFSQEFHGRPILNGFAEGSSNELRALALSRLNSETASKLSGLGVRYALVRQENSSQVVIPPGKPRSGYRRLFGVPGIAVYEVTAKPAPGMLLFGDGFGAEERGRRGARRAITFRWLESRRGTLTVERFCRMCRLRIDGRIKSFDVPRKLTFHYGLNRKTLTVPSERAVRVIIDLGFVGQRIRMRVDASPAPRPASQVIGGNDTRELAAAFSEFRISKVR